MATLKLWDNEVHTKHSYKLCFGHSNVSTNNEGIKLYRFAVLGNWIHFVSNLVMFDQNHTTYYLIFVLVVRALSVLSDLWEMQSERAWDWSFIVFWLTSRG